MGGREGGREGTQAKPGNQLLVCYMIYFPPEAINNIGFF